MILSLNQKNQNVFFVLNCKNGWTKSNWKPSKLLSVDGQAIAGAVFQGEVTGAVLSQADLNLLQFMTVGGNALNLSPKMTGWW